MFDLLTAPFVLLFDFIGLVFIIGFYVAIGFCIYKCVHHFSHTDDN